MKLPVYLDHHSTTPLDPRVKEAMEASLENAFGNPSSGDHVYGRRTRELVEEAREKVAKIISASREEIIFTSGATEANNLAIKGLVEIYGEKGKHIITQTTEHKSVLEVFKFLKTKGFEVTLLNVGDDGRVCVEELKQAIREETILVSIMFANNEIGTLQPIKEIGEIARQKNIFFHVDASQAVGKLPINVRDLGIHLMSFSAHKFYGPKGVGALYVCKENPRVRIKPLIHGGGQEHGLRSGTLNVPGIVGFGKACELTEFEINMEAKKLEELRDQFLNLLKAEFEDLVVNGSMEHRLGYNLNVSFPEVEGERLIKELSEEVALSTGSACVTDQAEPSYVLKAIGTPEMLIHSSIRIGMGRFNTEEEIDFAAKKIISIVRRLKKESPFKQVAEEI